MKKIPKYKKSSEIILIGQPISPGIAIGKSILLADDYIETKKRAIPVKKIKNEIESFNKALIETIKDLRLIIDQVGSRVSAHKREIFDAHLMILEDKAIIEQTVKEIRENKVNADFAYFNIMRSYQRNLSASNDTYFKERAIDIRDIKRRVIRKIQGRKNAGSANLKDNIIISRDLNLFDIYAIAKDNVAGIILEEGGRTTHATIIIRALEIPSVIGVERILQNVDTEDKAVVNGLTGEIILNPDSLTLKKSITKRNNYKKFEQRYLGISDLPSVSKDNVAFEVDANIELDDEVESVLAHGDFGIGLFRSEFMFMAEEKPPTEEEQFVKYANVVKRIHPHHVSIRTIDLGGDKFAPFLEAGAENNPFLGWRAIRICIDMPDLFKKQLRAIYRAGILGNVRLLLPMITSIEELRYVKTLAEEVKLDLRKQNIEYDANIPIGVMIEVPSAVMIADQLAKEADFFSIGTNDLVQYALAVDRGNPKVAYLYNFFHPAVLRLIEMTVKAGNNHKIPVSMCGEMAGDPSATILLFGIGIKEFSVSPVMMLKIKQILRCLEFSEAQKIAGNCLKMQTAEEIESYMRNVMLELFPNMDEDNFFPENS